MKSNIRFNGRFVVELPIVNVCNRKTIKIGNRLHTVDPPQLEEAVLMGQAISLVPINNKKPCHRDLIEGGNVPLGEGKEKHDCEPKRGRKTPSRKKSVADNLLASDTPVSLDYEVVSGLWKKAGFGK
jgi:hypothetical protein